MDVAGRARLGPQLAGKWRSWPWQSTLSPSVNSPRILGRMPNSKILSKKCCWVIMDLTMMTQQHFCHSWEGWCVRQKTRRLLWLNKKNVPSTQNKRKKETRTILMITKLAGTKLLHAEDKEHGNLDVTINNLEIWKTWKEAPALVLRAMLASQMKQSQHRQDPDSSAQYWTQTGTNYTPSSVSPFLKASTCLWVKRG